jgi:hypothetical protein
MAKGCLSDIALAPEALRLHHCSHSRGAWMNDGKKGTYSLDDQAGYSRKGEHAVLNEEGVAQHLWSGEAVVDVNHRSVSWQ